MCGLVLWVSVLLFFGAVASAAPESPDEETRSATRRWRTVDWVIDGDTLFLSGEVVVRLIGVDAPEIDHPTRPVEYFAQEASTFTRNAVEGRQVRLEYEPGATTDEYGRTLAYVYTGDGILLNKELIEQGYGRVYDRFPFSKWEEFRAAQREAERAGRGLWGARKGERHRGPRASHRSAQPDCVPPPGCCKLCIRGNACGDSCMPASYDCRREPGCACEASKVCP